MVMNRHMTNAEARANGSSAANSATKMPQRAQNRREELVCQSSAGAGTSQQRPKAARRA
jgi:hypothetical protein